MQYFDYSIWDKIHSLRISQDLPTLLDREKGIYIDDTPDMSIYGMNQLGLHIQNISDPIFVLEMSLLPILADMELEGVKCDISLLQDIGRRIRTDIERIQNEIYALVGSNVNINSPKQIQVLLFEKLGIKPLKKNKTGYSVDNEVLEEIAKTHDIARMILEYRSLSKLESTYVTGLLRAVHPVTQKIHTTYDSLGALTGRMSSEAPNLQNIPTGDGYAREIKSCFIPQSSNHVFLVADYSQIELRILAFLSQDTHLLEAFVQDEDIHMRTARFLFPEKEIITSHERRIAKTVNFGVIYGITGFGLSKTLECPPWEATKYIESFYSLYPGVRKYYDDLLKQARQDGYVSTYFGRKRTITSLNDANKTIRSIAEREAMNMPVQGTAADILKYAMIDIAKNIQEKQLHGKMILQVHDELVFDIPLDEKEYFESLVRDSMEGVLVRMIPDTGSMILPDIRVDISFGKNWAEAK